MMIHAKMMTSVTSCNPTTPSGMGFTRSGCKYSVQQLSCSASLRVLMMHGRCVAQKFSDIAVDASTTHRVGHE